MKAYIEHIREIVEAEPNDAIMGGMIRKYFTKVDTSEPVEEPKPINCQFCKTEITEKNKSHLYVEPVCTHCASKQHQREQDYKSFMNQYRKDHALCPKCRHSSHISTLAGFIYNADNKEGYKDLNNCTCSHCGDHHTAHERVSI